MRRPRRPLRRRFSPFRPPIVVSAHQRLLQRAHHMMETGRHADAAVIFENLAREAHDRGKLQHVPQLYLQAFRANLLARNIEAGQKLLYEGLGLLAKNQNWPRLQRTGARVIDELNQFGFPEMATEVEVWLQKTLPISTEPGEERKPIERGILPLKCPSCGGAIRPDDIEMLDEITGECAYCGSAIRKD